jgi:hypothetical protein
VLKSYNIWGKTGRHVTARAKNYSTHPSQGN